MIERGPGWELRLGRWQDVLAEEARAAVLAWSESTRGWAVIINDHVLAPTISAAFEAAGRYAFAPIPFVELGKQPRLTGDGPASWTCWLCVSRPRAVEFSRWGSLPGAYVPPPGAGTQRDRIIKGGKPLWLMRQIVGDYSRPGDLVCDPCAGGGTTLLAAVMEGRRAIGAECDPETFEMAVARLRKGWTRALPGLEAAPASQGGLWDE